jgi:hypothetical protein
MLHCGGARSSRAEQQLLIRIMESRSHITQAWSCDAACCASRRLGGQPRKAHDNDNSLIQLFRRRAVRPHLKCCGKPHGGCGRPENGWQQERVSLTASLAASIGALACVVKTRPV